VSIRIPGKVLKPTNSPAIRQAALACLATIFHMPIPPTAYTLLAGKSDEELITAVNTQMSHGWRPIGGPLATTNQNGEPILVQAMIR